MRINPDTGAPMAGNPFASNPNVNAQRIVAYGLRNEFRFAFRPGTNELWAGDVGWNTWEEINRIPNATDNVAENFGWPCYEGDAAQSGYDGANLNVCETLYPTGPDRAVLRVQPQCLGRGRRRLPDRRLVDQRHRVRDDQQLPGDLRRRHVLRRQLARLHLGDAARVERPAEPRDHRAVRDRRERAGAGAHRSRRRPVLRRARRRPAASGELPGRDEPAAGRGRHGDPDLRQRAADRAVQRGRLDRPGRHAAHLRVGPRRRRRVRRLDGRRAELDLPAAGSSCTSGCG